MADRRPYNRILRCANDPQYDPSPEVEDLTMLYRPLFWTSYWCEDWLHSSAYRNGARRVLISSASSKTAFCLAYAIRKRGIAGMRVVGLTSKKNLAFTRSLGLYDAVADYGSSFSSVPALSALPGDKWIYVDVAGQDALNARVFAHLGDPLVARIALGMTALSPAAPPGSLSTDWSGSTFSSPPQDAGKMEPFFMVEWLHVRRRQISPTDMFAMQNQAWRDLMRDCRNWVKMERVYGPDAVGEAYEHAVKRGIGPEKGYIWSLWEEDDRPTVKSRL